MMMMMMMMMMVMMMMMMMMMMGGCTIAAGSKVAHRVTITDSSLLHAKAILDCNSGHSTNYGDGDDDDDDDTDGDDNDDHFVAGGSGHSMLSKQCTRCRSSHFQKLYLVSI